MQCMIVKNEKLKINLGTYIPLREIPFVGLLLF